MCFSFNLIGSIVDDGEASAEFNGLLGHRIRIKIRPLEREKNDPGTYFSGIRGYAGRS